MAGEELSWDREKIRRVTPAGRGKGDGVSLGLVL